VNLGALVTMCESKERATVVISLLIEFVDSKLESMGGNHTYLFAGIPLSLYQIGECHPQVLSLGWSISHHSGLREVEVLKRWLKSDISTPRNVLAQFILSKLNWGYSEPELQEEVELLNSQDQIAKQRQELFISPGFHRFKHMYCIATFYETYQ